MVTNSSNGNIELNSKMNADSMTLLCNNVDADTCPPYL